MIIRTRIVRRRINYKIGFSFDHDGLDTEKTKP